jgi:hypothetical protein
MNSALPRCCGACRHFENDGAKLEAAFLGFRTMGSAFASTRAGDGLCALHQIYLSDRAVCARFEVRTAQP